MSSALPAAALALGAAALALGVRARAITPRSFKVAQFNILASNLAAPEHFPHTKPELLLWESRLPRLLRQIAALDADVLCLEELSDYWTDFAPALRRQGYASVFVKRPSLHRSSRSGLTKSDGCGIFFRESRFALETAADLNYADTHDRVAALAALRCRSTRRRLVVANTHLYWNAKKLDVQLAQLDQLEAFLAQHAGPGDALVLAGDMNNGPQSAVYERLSSSLSSAYAAYADGQEPPVTTVTSRRAWTIDYIFYSPETLAVRSLLPIPSEEELREEPGPPGWDGARGMPNSKHGSDHVPIMAELSWV